MSEDRIICQPASLIGSPNSDTSLPTETGSTALIIFFLAGSLLLGAILREVSKKTRIPCSSLLIIVGTIIGYYLHRFGIFADAVQEFLQIGPYGIMLIFIPTLVFESAFCTDWYIVKKVMKNIFVLAVPGVLLNSFLLAFTLKVILFYDDDHLTWPQALALSSLVSATDPIAIMSLLKNLGTPSKFNLLLIGESLMNNGMALVFFTLFMGISKEITKAPREVFLNFLQLAGGGPLLGCVVGILCSLWLRRITRDNILSITITFIACYLLFFAAETQLYVSGILAIVALGLFMSAYGKNKIDTKTEGTLESVWAWVQHASETLIFILAGLMIGYEIVLNSESTIEIYDLYKMLIFYGFMILARIIMIAACYPFIRRHGYGINGKEYFALIWCGLKGVIALSLALAANVLMLART